MWLTAPIDDKCRLDGSVSVQFSHRGQVVPWVTRWGKGTCSALVSGAGQRSPPVQCKRGVSVKEELRAFQEGQESKRCAIG